MKLNGLEMSVVKLRFSRLVSAKNLLVKVDFAGVAIAAAGNLVA